VEVLGQHLDVREPPVRRVVLLERDDDRGLGHGSRDDSLEESPQGRRALHQTPAKGVGHVVLAPSQ
jgi:hypothetical protein